MIVNNTPDLSIQKNQSPSKDVVIEPTSVVKDIDKTSTEEASTEPTEPVKRTEPTEPTEPVKKFSKKRAYDYLYKLNEEYGSHYSEEQIAKYANSGINMNFGKVFRAIGAPYLQAEEYDSLYNSFFDTEIPDKVEAEPENSEKKNTTESPSPLEVRQRSWESVREEGGVDWNRISQSPEPIIDGSNEKNIEHKSWSKEREMLEDAELEFGKEFYLKEFQTLEVSKFDNEQLSYTPFQESASLTDFINSADMAFFNMGEQEADSQFTTDFGMMGFTSKESGFGKNSIIITGPDGQSTKEVRLFTDNYKRIAGVVGDEVYREQYHIQDIRKWMIEQTNGSGFRESFFSDDSRSGVLAGVQSTMGLTKHDNEQFTYLTSIFSNTELAAMNDGVMFKPERAEYIITTKIQQLNENLKNLSRGYKKTNSSQGRFNTNFSNSEDGFTNYGLIKSIQDKIARLGMINDDTRAKAKRQSTLNGADMLRTGAYKQFDFAANDADVYLITSMGMDARDIPFDELTVNGRPSNYTEIHNLITDYDGIKDIRKGKIQIGINTEGVTSELSLSLFKDLESIVSRNKAIRNPGLLGNDSPIAALLTNTGLNLQDFGENLALSTLEVIGQIQYAGYDMYRAIGIADDDADMIWYPGTPFPMPMINPGHVKHIKEQYLPLYNSGITDADSFGEFMAKGSGAMAQSLPTTAVFLANPLVGLSVVGVSAYGRELYKIENDIIEAKKQVEEGGFSTRLSELQAQKLATMSLGKARGIALQIAGVETAVTRVFTYNFFKNAAAAKNFAGTKNATNARKLSNAYQKRYHKNFVENTAYRLGVSPRALSKEFAEEEIIAAHTYATEVMWGIREFNPEEFGKLLKETGFNTIFSSMGMAKMAQVSHSGKINRSVDDFLKVNIRLPQEAVVAEQHLRATEALKKAKNPRQRPINFDENNRTVKVDEDGNAEIQTNGEVAKPQIKSNEEIEMLEQVVDETATELLNFDKRKQELVDGMSKPDKTQFLDAMADIERYQSALSSSTEGGVAIKSLEKINAAQARARKLMLKYPSELSFNYLQNSAQLDYKERAAQAIIKERGLKKEDASYSLVSQDAMDLYMVVPEGDLKEEQSDISREDIDAKAIEIYLSESSSQRVQNMDGTLVLPGFNYLDAERMIPVISKEERDKFNLRGELNNIAGMRQGKMDFSTPVETKRKTDDLEVEEVLDFTKGQLPVNESMAQDDVALDSEAGAVIENKEEVVQNDMKAGLPILNAITQQSQATDQIRIDNLLGKLDFYDKETSNFMTQYLSPVMQSDIMRFMEDLKAGKRGNIGKIESIINAVDIAVDIQSQMPDGQISILQENGVNPVLQALTNLSQQLYDGNILTGEKSLATTTVMMKMLIKDNKVGKPFYDLNNEAGRISDAVKQQISEVKRTHLNAYQEEVKNSEEYKNASLFKKGELLNPNSLNNSYEMYALGMLYRMSGENNMANQDTEFSRAQSLIMQELGIRESNYKAMPDNEAFKGQYLLWKQMVEKLGVKNANSYEEVRGNASSYNANAIDRLSEAQPNEKALERIQDFNRFEPKVLRRYMPTFYNIDNGGGYTDAFGVEQTGSNGTTKSNQTKDVTMPETLGGENGLRLNPGLFWDQGYGSLQGLEMDVQGRTTYRTLSNLIDAPAFQEIFKGNVRNEKGEIILSDDYKTMQNIFKARESVFDMDIKSSHQSPADYGTVETSVGDVVNSAVGSAMAYYSTVSLGRITQNVSQYQSAVSGVMPLIQSRQALSYLRSKNTHFYLGHSNVLNGSASKSVLSNALQSMYKHTPYAANIYAQSRTGLRNSMSSELIVNQNKEMPISYFLRKYKITDIPSKEQTEQGSSKNPNTSTGLVKQETLPVVAPQKALPPYEQRLIGGNEAPTGPVPLSEEGKVLQRYENYGFRKGKLYTAKTFFDLISKSNSATLELLLAGGDRAAANATFESLYLDYRVRQGVEFKDAKSFWESENKNPNKEAINYADTQIDMTQTQTTSTSQAGIYSEYSSSSAKNLARLIIPFSRFNMNARSAVNTKISALNDPNIDESQKKEARRFINGKVREVAFFRATAVLGWTAIATGANGLLASVGLVEKDDIERYGGLTRLIGDNILPIEDRSIVEIPQGAYTSASSVEEMKIFARQMELSVSNIAQDMADVKRTLMVYENKYTLTSFSPEVLRDVFQDVVSTNLPIPRPTIADDAMAMVFNYGMELLGVPVEANEFLSGDLKGMNTTDGIIGLLQNNAGMASIGIQQAENLIRAFTLHGQGKVFKYNPMTPEGEIPVAVSAISPEIRDQLSNATNVILMLRLGNVFIPGIPKSDINKLASRIERQLEYLFDAVLTDEDGNPSGEFNINYETEEQENPTRRNVLDDKN